MKILITGGAGHIGSVLTPLLLAYGHDVTVLDNFSHGENSLAACCASPTFHIVNGDCRNSAVLEVLIHQADVIIPLAALVGAPACAQNESAAITTNFEAVRLLCDFASPSTAIIIPNTNSGYGSSEAICTEDSPLKPLSLYGETKFAAECAVMARENSISLRLATVFGASPRMRTDLLVNDFVLRAVRDRSLVLFEPQFARNFIHVRDVAAAFLHCIDNFSAMRGQIYNCGDSRANMTKTELCYRVNEHVDFEWFEGGGSDPDKRDYIVSNEKLEATGWRPQHSLDDGIEELVKLYRTLRSNRYGNA